MRSLGSSCGVLLYPPDGRAVKAGAVLLLLKNCANCGKIAHAGNLTRNSFYRAAREPVTLAWQAASRSFISVGRVCYVPIVAPAS